MKKILLLLSAISLASQAATGYPVYSMLRDTVYKVHMGTAFVVRYKDRSYMISNWHVCRYFTKSVATNEKRKIAETVKIVKTLPEKDLCILTTTRTDGLEIGSDVGEKASIYTAGYPEYSQTIQLRSGHTTSFHEEDLNYGSISCPKTFEMNPTIDPLTKQTITMCKNKQMIMDTNLEGTGGNSGSPVVNSKGQLVGIVHSRTEGKPADDHHNTLNYIPVSDLVKFLDSL